MGLSGELHARRGTDSAKVLRQGRPFMFEDKKACIISEEE